VFQFLLVFALLLAAFYLVIAFVPFYNRHFVPRYHHLITNVAGLLLTSLGQQVVTTGTSIGSAQFAVSIVSGCDAVEPIALFVCAILVFPAPVFRKILGAILGTSLLLLSNLARIVSLFLIGRYSPRIFEVVHVDVWQALFVFLALLLWIVWLLWATRIPRTASRPAR
jgi:exosortase/archaeosortase family protein